jgi:outer membrane murein-binding lipoprotein Lpp
MTRLPLAPLVLLLLAGCASTDQAGSASSATSTVQAQCERTGGQWRGGMCENAQGGGGGGY